MYKFTCTFHNFLFIRDSNAFNLVSSASWAALVAQLVHRASVYIWKPGGHELKACRH